MSSMSREPMRCSTEPTVRKSRALATAWKISSMMPAHTASGEPTPAHMTMSPRLAMVE